MTETFSTVTGSDRGETSFDGADAVVVAYRGATLDLLADADVDAGCVFGADSLVVEVPGVVGLPADIAGEAYAHWAEHLSGVRSDAGASISVRRVIDPLGRIADFSITVTSSDVDEVWLDGASDVIADLAHAHYGGRPMESVVGDVDAEAARLSARNKSSDVFDRDHWHRFADELEDLEPAQVARGGGRGTQAAVRSARVARRATGSSHGDVAALVGRALVVARGLSGDLGDGLLVDVEEPARTPDLVAVPGRIRRRFPLLLSTEVLESDGAVTDVDAQTASDYGALRFDNPLADGLFDDLAEAEVLVALRSGDAMPDPTSRKGEITDFGRYRVIVTVWIPRRDGDVAVDVVVAPDVDVDADRLCAGIVDGLVRSGVRPPADARRVGVPEPLVEVSAAARAAVEQTFGAVRDILPVSTLQEGLLYHLSSAQSSDTTDLYASQFHLRLAGPVDSNRMRDAVASLLRRHPNLAAGFITFGDRSLSVVPAVVDPDFTVVRSSEWDHRAGLDVLFAEERTRPFSATRPPLIRFLLVEESATESVLCVTFEHIVADGWSAGLMMDTLLELYSDPTGRDLPAPVPFRDYLEWLSGRDLGAARAVWAREMSGIDQPTLIRPDADASAASTAMARDYHHDLDAELSERVRAAAGRAGVTVSTFLQTAWGVVLSRLVGSDDVVFGTTVSGRPPELAGSERIVGLLFNTVPVRVRTRPSQSIGELLSAVNTSTVAVLDHPYVGLGDIHAAAGLRALFDTLFIIQNHPGRDESRTYGPDGDVRVTQADLTDSTHYPISYAVHPGETIHIRCAYRGDLYNAGEIASLTERFTTVLESMSTDLTAPVGSMSIATAAELADAATKWNGGDRAVRDVTVATLFDECVARGGDDVALVAGPRRLSFTALGDEVNRHARMFARLGASPEARVLLMLPRDHRMIVAMFATFATGAAYVPVDADYPADRIGYMVDAARPTLIVTVGSLRDRPGYRETFDATACPVLDLDADAERIAALDPSPLSRAERPTHATADNLAYIIFTSGSTGRPKGVAVPYRGLTNMYANHLERIFDHVVGSQGGRRMRIAHTTSFSFDASWEQLFWMLAGHEVHVIDEDLRRDPAALLAYYDSASVDGFDVTPSYAMHLVEQGLLDRDRPRGRSVAAEAEGVVFVSLGGEAVPDVLWTALRNAPGVQGYNLYGPTEYTINALGADVADSTVSSVGRPIFNTRAHILDSSLHPVLPQVAGELYLAGAGTARGYQDQPALTADRFVACPWGDGERMYRTGDLARWRADGSIEYLGRADDQVKIRGFRIELGEVANVLLESEMVGQATVVVRDGASGPTLVAYVVASDAADLDVDRLRDHAASRLPDYMVPSAFGRLDEIPLTINGKVDVRALPAVDVAHDEYVAPHDELEAAVADIVAGALGVDRVSVVDDFFAIGGHSLLAMRVVARVNADLDADLSMREVFDAPTVVGIAAAVRTSAGARAAVVDTVVGSIVPASSGQRSLWLIDQVSGASSMYTIPVVMTAPADFDPNAWTAALRDVVIRQEALRTVLLESDGELVQEVTPADVVDERLHVDRFHFRDHTRPLDVVREWVGRPVLAGDFPVRAAIGTAQAGSGSTDHPAVVALAIHHASIDEWSLPVLLRDLGIAYTARAAGSVPDFTPLTSSYRQYSVWQQDMLADSTDALDHWVERLDGAPEISMIATDRARPAMWDSDGLSVDLVVPADVTARLRDLCAAEDASMYMLVQAAVAVAMHGLGAGDDIVLGSPVGGRGDTALDDLVGYFVNTLPLRHRLDGNPTLLDVIARVRETVLDGFAHQDVPFDMIVGRSGVSRSSAYNPLFQTLVTYRVDGVIGDDADLLDDAGFGPLPERVEVGTVKADLEIDLAEQTGGLTGVIAYARALFDSSTAERLARGLVRVLTAFADDPSLRLSEMAVSGDLDAAAITAWSTGVGRVPAAEAPLGELLVDAFSRYDDRVAVVADGESLTYRELNRSASAIARRLRVIGLEPEDRVALLIPRSATMVAGFVAVPLAGGVILPIDTSYPDDRITAILADARPTVLLVSAGTHTRFASAASAIGASLINVDQLDDSATPVDGISGAPRARVSNAAYAVYTSGSTGRPKGILVDHTAIVNLIRWRQCEFELQPGDGVLQKTSLGFDPAIPEILWPLLYGARVVVAAAGGDRDLRYLADLLSSGDVTFAELVPSVAAAMLDDGVTLAGSAVKYLSLGGEALSASLLERILDQWGLRVWNTYGPAEAAVEVTSFEAGDSPVADRGAVPIGVPVADTVVRVLDDLLRPVAPGVVGDLYIGGRQLARGYLDRVDLTAAFFVADPFGASGDRLYRTGDLVRWNDDGQLVFIGRSDHQVKINGSRVEPGDVEAAVSAAPEVGHCAVVVSRSQGSARLVAYVTPGSQGAAALDTDRLRADLRGRLPVHMVPSAVIAVDALPLTPNGKLDVAALEALEDSAAPAPGRAPDGDVETEIAGAFTDILGVETVDADSDFFRLGGHSLLAMRIVSRLNSSLGTNLSLRDVFDSPTVAALAGAVASAGPSENDAFRVADVAVGSVVPASFGQQALWLIGQVTGPGSVYTIPVVLTVDAHFDEDAWFAALVDVTVRHDALRTTLIESGGELVQVAVPADEVAGRLAPDRFVLDSADDAHARIEEWVQHPVTSGADYPVRSAVFRGVGAELSESGTVVALAIDHVAVDEWSLPPLLRDLGDAYRARRSGGVPEFNAPTVTYAQYSVWQRQTFGSVDDPTPLCRTRLDYWRRHVDGAPEVSMVAVDRPRPAVAEYEGFTVDFEVDSDVTLALRELCERSDTTMYMLVQAAVAVMMRGYGAGDDIVLGSPVGGRGDADLDAVVGYFVNTLPLRHRLDGDPTLSDVLAQARETVLNGFANQDVPFERIVGHVGAPRSSAHNPLFQTLVTYRVADVMGTTVDSLADAGLEPVATRIGIGSVKSDLEIDLGEQRVGGGLAGTVSCASSLFDEATGRRLAAGMRTVLAAFATDADRRLSAVSVIDHAQRTCIDAWSAGPRVPLEAEASIDRLLVEVARSSRDRIAVRAGGERLDYAEFDAAVNRLARALAATGVRRGDRVAVMLHRSISLPAVLAGVLRSGAAFVPIDPTNPADRIDYVLDQSGARIVVVDDSTRDVLSTLTTVPTVLDLGDDRVRSTLASSSPEPVSDAERGGPIRGRDVAYVIYTSGSTGRPKGVVVEHRGFVNFLRWKQETTGIDLDDRILQKTPISFDASLWEFFVPLMVGATVVMAEPDGHRDPDYLARVIAEERLTTVEFVPSMLDALLEHGLDDVDLSSVRRVFCGGEALSVATAAAALERFGDIVHNLYGPTETTVGIAGKHVTAGLLASGARFGGGLPIGVPAYNSGARVLDASLAPTPIGVVGELYLDGVQLAQGYSGRPDLTAAAFVADPFRAGERMYRTGDLVRWNSGGDLEYLGRVDDQIKIRGFRIEIDEIRTVVEQHPAVGSAAVVARDRRDAGDRVLVAYYTVVGDVDDTVEPSIIAHTASTLPDYMTPSSWVRIDSIPVTSNGKLDTRALPEPVHVSAGGREPTTPTEIEVVAAIRDVLGLDDTTRITVDDDFFRLGGHSLLAARLVGRLGAGLTLKSVFSRPTVGALASAIDEGRTVDDPILLPLAESGTAGTVFAIHASSGFGTVYSTLRPNLPPGVGLIALQDPAHAGEPRDVESLDELVDVYADAVIDSGAARPYNLLGWSYGGHLAFGVARRLQEQEIAVETVTILDTPAVTPETVVTWADADRDTRVRSSFAQFAGLPHANLPNDRLPERDELAALNTTSDGPLASLSISESMAFMDSFDRCLRLQESTPTHGVLRARGLLVIGSDHEETADDMAAGWRAHFADDIDVERVDVGHEDLLTTSGVPAWSPWWANRLHQTPGED
ncbi:amino acid adenylation domain-containing protein [Gordonia sp. PDNC005]|uniref:non-ribosomal peptide synthetase n=1 Tax=Gordonia sp. PDNC005 TaxID=2811424 RepID=UPI0019627061|nr:non-ribosomal peptide synthetase [Gordonia sp. PDNC005]QRY60950.1 amino acid adenylation domain-containing protein [Gordonia sp. PDNC005]